MHQRLFEVRGLLNQGVYGVLVTACEVLALVVEPWMGCLGFLRDGLKFAICPSDGCADVAMLFT